LGCVCASSRESAAKHIEGTGAAAATVVPNGRVVDAAADLPATLLVTRIQVGHGMAWRLLGVCGLDLTMCGCHC